MTGAGFAVIAAGEFSEYRRLRWQFKTRDRSI
jgi:hypothetical protein